MEKCPSIKTNTARCACTYSSCSRKGRCCECLSYHLANRELPGCCFSPEVERAYDRSFARFIQAQSS
ncbi:MAG: DUF6485 family protein [Verrucomicrobiota bacterium]|nr:DUF6485 family protein [Verrucomicrobiota bacterium]